LRFFYKICRLKRNIFVIFRFLVIFWKFFNKIFFDKVKKFQFLELFLPIWFIQLTFIIWKFTFRSVRKRPEKTELKKSTSPQNSGVEARKSSKIWWNFRDIWMQILSSLELYRLLSNSNKTRKVSLHTLDYLEKVKIEWIAFDASSNPFWSRIFEIFKSTDLWKSQMQKLNKKGSSS